MTFSFVPELKMSLEGSATAHPAQIMFQNHLESDPRIRDIQHIHHFSRNFKRREALSQRAIPTQASHGAKNL